MSKSLGNAIGINEPAPSMYAKLMSISDELMWRYWIFLTDVPQRDIDQMQAEVAAGALHPMQAKKNLAHIITAGFHSVAEADAAAEGWATQFQQKGVADDVPEILVKMQSVQLAFTNHGNTSLPSEDQPIHVPSLLVLAGLALERRSATQTERECGEYKWGKINACDTAPGGAWFLPDPAAREKGCPPPLD